MSASLCLGLLAGALSGCGGSEDPAAGAAPSPTASARWEVDASRSLELVPGGSFDLAATLPADVARGGAFSINPSGAPLPAGIRLDPAGLLIAERTSPGVTAAGVVFRYSPPA